MIPPELLTEWARLLLGSLRAAGLRHVVISPGSRSTPFAWAALRDPGLECRSIVDERSAAFFAVGRARLTGTPVLLICTSGSAAANYFPAVVEAAEASVPLLVLTADRPLELQHAAAPQTIDQIRLYGDHVRAFIELGAPDPDPRMFRGLPRLAAQAVFASRWPLPGPVHLNARARKPLEPVGPTAATGTGDGPGGGLPDADSLVAALQPTNPPGVRPDPGAIAALADRLAGADRGLLVCGPALPRDAADIGTVSELARLAGLPVVAEPASQLRLGNGPRPEHDLDAFAALLEIDGFAEAHRPDLVIQVGRPPTASAWTRALDAWATEHWVLAPHGWPTWHADARVIHGHPTAAVGSLVDALRERGDPPPTPDAGAPEAVGAGVPGSAADGWLDRLAGANAAAWRATGASLEDGFSEGAAVREVVDRLERGAVLALGNSLPIREVERFVPAADRGLVVWSQRGANGIDGLVSGAAGAASAGRPTTLLLGDVSFLHDIGGLAAARELPAPLTVVVLNNGGGRIFERLPLAEQLDGDPAMDAWLTPPRLDIEAACRAFGVRYARAADRASLAAALDGAPDGGAPDGGPDAPSSCSVIEVIVPDGGTTAHQRELRDRIAAELDA